MLGKLQLKPKSELKLQHNLYNGDIMDNLFVECRIEVNQLNLNRVEEAKLLKVPLDCNLISQCHGLNLVFEFIRKEAWYEPDHSLYGDLMLIFGKKKLIDRVEKLFAKLNSKGLEHDIRAYTELIGAYLKVEMIDKSDFVCGIQQSSMEELSSFIDQEDTESDLMLHFLEFLKEQKQIVAAKVVEDIRCLESDIAEIESRRGTPDRYTEESEGHEVLRSQENNNVRDKKMDAVKKRLDCLGVFFNGLCKYARYSKFEVRGILRNGDFSSMGNVICSLGFDRDEDYIATARVSKKIKVFDFNALLNDSVDIHYPAVEM
ncbi:SPA1-related 2-like protein isoform X1 [Tanacetum coccineum]|uniref:SPA1-related 2-like protein isoform X1 n=1 Tax=Tanacetum coccineum TaxID=301880 RepID=A0ABQ4Y5J9_9ASTR